MRVVAIFLSVIFISPLISKGRVDSGFINMRECPECGEIYCTDFQSHKCPKADSAEEVIADYGNLCTAHASDLLLQFPPKSHFRTSLTYKKLTSCSK